MADQGHVDETMNDGPEFEARESTPAAEAEAQTAREQLFAELFQITSDEEAAELDALRETRPGIVRATIEAARQSLRYFWEHPFRPDEAIMVADNVIRWGERREDDKMWMRFARMVLYPLVGLAATGVDILDVLIPTHKLREALQKGLAENQPLKRIEAGIIGSNKKIAKSLEERFGVDPELLDNGKYVPLSETVASAATAFVETAIEYGTDEAITRGFNMLLARLTGEEKAQFPSMYARFVSNWLNLIPFLSEVVDPVNVEAVVMKLPNNCIITGAYSQRFYEAMNTWLQRMDDRNTIRGWLFGLVHGAGMQAGKIISKATFGANSSAILREMILNKLGIGRRARMVAAAA